MGINAHPPGQFFLSFRAYGKADSGDHCLWAICRDRSLFTTILQLWPYQAAPATKGSNLDYVHEKATGKIWIDDIA